MHLVVLPPVLTLGRVSLIYGIQALGLRRPPWNCEEPAFGSGTSSEPACVWSLWSRELDGGVLWEDLGSAPPWSLDEVGERRDNASKRQRTQGRESRRGTTNCALTSARRAGRARVHGQPRSARPRQDPRAGWLLFFPFFSSVTSARSLSLL